ncbi:hypothetical protein KO505_03965 [Psychrosphaera sp. F3M07]|uniref:hypothetical protein n=1 Tax=Psychrosphaera sp. F3M07 TaxID=2841560 RepID=UPI001C08A216|nr:hypothetical protein [Psychrosphaera sp. F3M07]MBU2917119.1 hypothetical protein [Psychrosphaera sp. F3M07]
MCRKSILLKLFVIALTVFVSADVKSVTVTETRLFLSPKLKFTSMSVINSDDKPLNCVIEVRNLDVANGKLVLATSGESNNPSPERMVRLAPSRFKLGVRKVQEFRAIYRRKPGVEDGEYIGAVAIICKEESNESLEKVKITPTLVQNIPLIVRTAELKSEVSFANVTKQGNKVFAEMIVSGQRSVTGDVTIGSQKTGAVIRELKKISHYPGQGAKQLEFDLESETDMPLKVMFNEIKESGNIKEESPIGN